MRELNRRDIANNLLAIFPLINKKLFPTSKLTQQSDLNITHFFILKTLEDAGDLTLTEIGKRLSILKSNLTPLVQKLEKKEYVTLIPAKKDRRLKYLQLTEEGAAYLKEHQYLLAQEIQKRLGKLEYSDLEKLNESVSHLQEVISKLDNEEDR
ncbi:MarR family transcriptional regulator [Salibacterium salarium]|uniref:MarR family transcriptional regulator n=1 Tax=Salibacterium salarium TaxID=284579 RepID=A0A428N3Q5_9BACI|nr:MarR family transcriptional regulator [Salibacterium salarium]RSL33070.1 MarR family transcriptional regulator [Salibacterium salarium]